MSIASQGCYNFFGRLLCGKDLWSLFDKRKRDGSFSHKLDINLYLPVLIVQNAILNPKSGGGVMNARKSFLRIFDQIYSL